MDWVDLVTFILKSCTRHPQSVVVTSHQKGDREILMVEVDEKDRAQVIGRGGRNIQALERVLSIGCDLHSNPSIRIPRIKLRG